MTDQKTRKSYDNQFKLDVTQRSYRRDNISELADELGNSRELIHCWRREYKKVPDISFPSNGNVKQMTEEKELARIHRGNADLRMKRDILKKTIGIFSWERG